MRTSVRTFLNTTVLYIKLLASTVIAFFNIPLLLKALGVDDYGIFSVVGGVIALLMFLNYTMTTATNRFLAVSEGKNADLLERQGVFNLCLMLHLVLAVFLAVVLEFIFVFFWDRLLNIAPDRQYAAKAVYQTMVATTFMTVAVIPYNGVIIAKEKIFFVALTALFGSVAKLGITFLLFLVDADRLIIYALLLLLVNAIEKFASIWYCHVLEKIKYNFRRLDFSLFKQMSAFMGWSMTINFSLPAVINGTSVLLNRFFGVAVNAAEGIAVQIAGQLTGICSSMLSAVTPVIMKKHGAERHEHALSISLTSCRLSVYLLMLVGVAVFAEMPFLLKIWLRTVPPFTVVFCRLILLRVIVEQATLPLAVLMNANGDIKVMQLASSAVYLFTLLTEYLILRYFHGAPYSVYICMIVMMAVVGAIRVKCVKKHYALRVTQFLVDNVLRECGVMIFGAVSVAGMSLLMPESIWRCLLTFAVSGLVMSAAVLWFGITGEERKLCLTMYESIKLKLGFPQVVGYGEKQG